MDKPAKSYLFYQSRQRRPVLGEARGVYIWDVDGKRYLDGSSGAMVANIGHSNERVLAAMRQQMEKATFGYRLHFENEPAEELARMTAERMPAGLERVFFVSGGSEAVESAIKLARQYAVATGQPSRWKVISRTPSYHGSTLGALALTGMSSMTEPFAPMMREMPKIPAPTCYLDRDDLAEEERGLRYAEMLREKIEEEGPETVLAFIMEPVGGASTGALVAPDSYYRRIREICDEFGILLIYDEVMTGAGRTGKFLAAEHWDQHPISSRCPRASPPAMRRLAQWWRMKDWSNRCWPRAASSMATPMPAIRWPAPPGWPSSRKSTAAIWSTRPRRWGRC